MPRKVIRRLAIAFVVAIALATGFSATAHAEPSGSVAVATADQAGTSLDPDTVDGPVWPQ